MELFIFARFHARPDEEGALAAAPLDVLAPTREEPGCVAIHALRFVERVTAAIDHPLDVSRTAQIG
jgi:quinol monooxygenase YgiN